MSGSGIDWAICKPAPRFRQIPRQYPTTQFFTGRMPFLPPNEQRQSTEGCLKSECNVMRRWCVSCRRAMVRAACFSGGWCVCARRPPSATSHRPASTLSSTRPNPSSNAPVSIDATVSACDCAFSIATAQFYELPPTGTCRGRACT